MSDIVERLTTPLCGNEFRVMVTWDSIRQLLLVEHNKGSYPRDVFENMLSDFDEEREEAARTITELRTELAKARKEALEEAQQAVRDAWEPGGRNTLMHVNDAIRALSREDERG